MPTVAPPGPGDPAALGPYRLTGRLGEATYTAVSPSGERVVVKRFAAASRPDPDRLEALRRAAVVGTALVAGSGPDYVVTEHVDGPSLEEDVAAAGPRSGPALHRLAIATMTTVAALHRAGLHAGHVRPDRIVLGPDGPRLLCDGSAAPNPPLWCSPEEAAGDPVGPPADVFCWAATVVYAASGRPPFTEEERLAHGAANLDPLDGDLRQLVADCLAAEPGARPPAEEVLLRLIGHSGMLDTLIPAGGEATSPPGGGPTQPSESRSGTAASHAGRSWLALAAAGTALALACGGAAYALTPRQARQAAAVTAASTTPEAAAQTGTTPAVPGSSRRRTPRTSRRTWRCRGRRGPRASSDGRRTGPGSSAPTPPRSRSWALGCGTCPGGWCAACTGPDRRSVRATCSRRPAACSPPPSAKSATPYACGTPPRAYAPGRFPP
ncbi:MAG: hypothetical protein IRZ07_13985 [Microbispora sp.]|nr:hypothetical protein [Microbispora sp.]